MKCRLIKPMKAFNPDYDRKEAEAAKEAGEVYPHEKIIERPVGHIQDHPDCWKHCVRGHMNADPNAVPEDEECRQKVREWQAERPEQLKKLASILKAAPKTAHKELREAYASELHDIDPNAFPLTGEEDDSEFYEEEEDD